MTDLRAYLVALDPAVQPALYYLDTSECSLGRLDANTVRIERSGVSRYHALIVRDHGSYLLTDQDSSWGTYLNGQLLAPRQAQRLTHDDLIGLGHPTPLLRFCDSDPTSPPPPLPLATLEYQTQTRQFTLRGQPLPLSEQGHKLLRHLAAHPGFSRAEACVQAVWEMPAGGAEELVGRLHGLVRTLRRQLEQQQQGLSEQQQVRIETKRGHGYRLVLPAAPSEAERP